MAAARSVGDEAEKQMVRAKRGRCSGSRELPGHLQVNTEVPQQGSEPPALT